MPTDTNELAFPTLEQFVENPAGIESPTEGTDEGNEDSQEGFNPLAYLDDPEGTPNEGAESREISSTGKKTGAASGSPHIEKIQVGSKGQKREIEIDFSNKEALKKYVTEAHNFKNGMRQFQKERDEVKQRLAEKEKALAEHERDWNTLNEIWEKGGPKAVLARLSGGNNSVVDKFLDEAIAERQRWAEMSPDERAQIQAQNERKQTSEREKALERKYEEKLAEIDKRQQSLMERDIQTKASSALSKYGFNGVLGNEDAEFEWNDTLWTRVMSNLSKVPENTEITQEILDREFRAVATRMKKAVTSQVRENTKAAVDKAKANTMSKIQAHVSPKAASSDEQRFKADMRSGNIGGALQSLLTGKVRL